MHGGAPNHAPYNAPGTPDPSAHAGPNPASASGQGLPYPAGPGLGRSSFSAASLQAPPAAAFPICLICLEMLTPDDFSGGRAIALECGCTGDMALRHRQCAIDWNNVSHAVGRGASLKTRSIEHVCRLGSCCVTNGPP